MYQYLWDSETGGFLLTSEQSKFSKEPRPVYYRELDLLGFDQYWVYPRNDLAPIMWAEANNYIYQGKIIAKTLGGSVYTAPKLIVVQGPDIIGNTLRQVDIETMVHKNNELLETLSLETIQGIYNIYREYKDSIDVFYVAFSGGKDSVVALDHVQRALPHDDFFVMFGDTRMEFPDTYEVIDKAEEVCHKAGIQFYRAQSNMTPQQTWRIFGPPSTTNRWCCSVHKTSPQIQLLRKITEKDDFTGMAFTGVRAEESLTRSEYDSLNIGKKHSGQLSYHCILNWNSAELFLYIYAHDLIINEAYKKGNARAGCLVCPNSSGRHEYVKRTCYQEESDQFLDLIASTSGKTNYSESEMKSFINDGYWRTRRSGRELNFGQDLFEVKPDDRPPKIIVYRENLDWKQWAKTIGGITQTNDNAYVIKFGNKLYEVITEVCKGAIIFSLPNCGKSKEDIRFFSLMRSAIVKTLYCVGCGVCEAECKYSCIKMNENNVEIGDNCVHCHNCHDIHEHCLRYNSIRNKISEGKKMAGLDRYFSFGSRAQWLEIFCKYNGGADFWESDGDGLVANKKKDAFKNFAVDAGLVEFDKKAMGDKYTKCLPTKFASIVEKLGAYDQSSWGLILSNLVYTPAFNWFVQNLKQGVCYTPDSLKLMLTDVMESDTKGLGKRNVVDAFKIFMSKTPLGTDHIFAICDVDERTTASRQETITLNYVTRCAWDNPVSEVILYGLYKFAEACGNYHQFTLETLLDDSIERDGVSPARIFGLDKDTMTRILNGLAVNYPDYISVSFTLDLDNITLRTDKTSADVLQLF